MLVSLNHPFHLTYVSDATWSEDFIFFLTHSTYCADSLDSRKYLKEFRRFVDLAMHSPSFVRIYDTSDESEQVDLDKWDIWEDVAVVSSSTLRRLLNWLSDEDWEVILLLFECKLDQTGIGDILLKSFVCPLHGIHCQIQALLTMKMTSTTLRENSWLVAISLIRDLVEYYWDSLLEKEHILNDRRLIHPVRFRHHRFDGRRTSLSERSGWYNAKR